MPRGARISMQRPLQVCVRMRVLCVWHESHDRRTEAQRGQLRQWQPLPLSLTVSPVHNGHVAGEAWTSYI